MTVRAFILGLFAVAAVGLLDPYTSFNKGYGWMTQGHFPVAAAFLLVVFTVGVNTVLRLVRRSAALRRPELMLIWCMLIVGCSFPSNLMRFWFPTLAAPPYLARRPDVAWKDTALERIPGTLLLSKDPRSLAAERFFEGGQVEGRLPWDQWLVPITRWAVLMVLFYAATLFLCAILRRQWVERERLQFPLARIPLEFTSEGPGGGVLPAVFSNGAMVAGLATGIGLKLLRAMPIFFGGQQSWNVTVPLQEVFMQTPLENLHMVSFQLIWMPIGLGYLVSADVSLSIWFFYLLGRVELLVASWAGSPLHYGGSYSELVRWHRPGAYLAFTVGTLFIARRHLADVVRKAVGRGRAVDDSAEPVGFRLAFWGLVLCSAGAAAWFAWYGVKVWAAALYVLLLLIMQLVHSRLVAQSGVYRTAPLPQGPGLLHALGLGHVFGPTGAVVTNVQYTIMIGGNNSMLGPAAIHAFRIGEVFKRGRRLLLPVLMAAVVVSIAASSCTCLRQAYTDGALNYTHTWASIANPKSSFDLAHQMIQHPYDVAPVRWIPFGLGAVLTAAVMFMRARFYWWPVHPIGLLAFASFGVDRMWFSFFLGWLIKVTFLQFGSGRLLQRGRHFFIGFIISELFFDASWSLVCTLSGGRVPGAGVWI